VSLRTPLPPPPTPSGATESQTATLREPVVTSGVSRYGLGCIFTATAKKSAASSPARGATARPSVIVGDSVSTGVSRCRAFAVSSGQWTGRASQRERDVEDPHESASPTKAEREESKARPAHAETLAKKEIHHDFLSTWPAHGVFVPDSRRESFFRPSGGLTIPMRLRRAAESRRHPVPLGFLLDRGSPDCRETTGVEWFHSGCSGGKCPLSSQIGQFYLDIATRIPFTGTVPSPRWTPRRAAPGNNAA
jgi:hypothetical protein